MAGPWDPDEQVPDEEWVRPVKRSRPPPRSAPGSSSRPAPRSRGPTIPVVPTVVIAVVVVVLAFALGRVTAGGGDDDGTAVNAAALQATTTTVEQLTHTVGSGESLLGIASQYGVTAEAIAFVNGLSNQNHVFVGQVLKIPPSKLAPVATTTTSTTRKSG